MTRTAVVVLGGGVLLLVWVMASGAPRPAPQRDTPQPRQAPAPVPDLDREAARLHERLTNPPRYPSPQRDPFTFGAVRPVPVHPRVVVAPLAASPVVEVPPVPVSDVPRLVAVLTDAADGGAIRRAVLAVGDDVQVLRPGETVLHYRIRSIGADAIDLVDIVTGVVTRVSLR